MAAEMFRLALLRYAAEEEMQEERPPRMVRERKSPFQLEEKKFVNFYRVTKDLAADLIRELTPHIRAPSRSSALTVETKVFAALRFFAGGPYQSYVGGSEFTAMDQSTVSRCITEVTDAINEHLLERWIVLDLSPESVGRLRLKFYEKYGFPGVVGAIDCTHVAIIAPPVNHPIYMERQYFNHKRFHSINVQLVCDSDMRILNVNARYPGATNDAFIYAHSEVRRGLHAMRQQHNTNAWLIGDGGYPLEPVLMTPVAGEIAPNSPEERYNRALCRARSIIEQCNGLLKSRWRCLLKHRVLHYMPEKASAIINSCCILHNMCISRNIPPPMEMANIEVGDGNGEALLHVGHDQRAGRSVRDHIIRENFSEQN